MAQIDIRDNFNFILTKMQNKLNEKNIPYILDYLVCGIDQEEFLTSYYYASLIRELENEELEKSVHNLTVSTLKQELSSNNGQKAVRWSRFLGELYNYSCLKRKDLMADLLNVLKGCGEMISGALKCLCSALETSKGYLDMSNPKKEREIMLMLLHLKVIKY